MRFEFPGDELEWIEQQLAGVRTSIKRLRSELANEESQFSHLHSALETAAAKGADTIVISFVKEKSIRRMS